ncbi:hypothetical protein [Ottowia thiooxydans]|uniref:hypothetical protein n=1 Tax=Ottowia thiooxydans TaxID=219182 RepID=UPI0003F8EB0F|nr:hypothetical protein [Ottowia thiooxydans]
MKLSATFNFFDGGELLVPVLQSIRPHVDHLSVVFQERSNYGNPSSQISRVALQEATALGLIDSLLSYTPDLALRGGRNEFRKRVMGLECAKAAGADHLMFCDVDEFYVPQQLEDAKRFIEEHGIDFTTVSYVNYYGRPTLQLRGIGAEHVPNHQTAFICRLTEQTTHEFCGWYPVDQVDPTRCIYVKGGKHHIFSAQDITMHHMTGIRLDIEEKLKNSSCNDVPSVIKQIRENFASLPQLIQGSHTLANGLTVHLDEVPDFFNLTAVLRLAAKDK